MTTISSIYNQGPSPEPQGRDAENRNQSKFQEAWHQHNLAVIDPASIDDEWLRQGLINEANKRFGRRDT